MAKSGNALPSAFSLFSKSWTGVKRNMNAFAIVYALPLIATLVSMFNALDGTNNVEPTAVDLSATFGGWSPLSIVSILGGAFVVMIIFAFLGSILQTMMHVLELQTAAGKTVEIGAVWQTSKPLIWRMFGLQITIAAIFVGSFLLLIIPFFFAVRRYFLAPYYMVDKNLTIKEALKQSAAQSKSFAGAIWGVIGVIILLSFTGVVPVFGGLISFCLGIAYSVAPAIRYFEIKKHA